MVLSGKSIGKDVRTWLKAVEKLACFQNGCVSRAVVNFPGAKQRERFERRYPTHPASIGR